MQNKDLTANNLAVVKAMVASIKDMSEEEMHKLIKGMVQFYNYSVNNQFLLAHQGCSQVASFKKWQDIGRQVKKGAKAAWIFAPNMYRKEDEEESTVCGFRCIPVFDISQTEGKEVERYSMTMDSPLQLRKVKELAVKLGYTVETLPLEIAKGGYISGRNIVLNGNLSEIENTGTLIHELCHGQLGHTEANDAHSRDQKEQEAELTTYIVCEAVGVTRRSQLYLKSWGLSEDIMGEFKKINKVAKQIISALI